MSLLVGELDALDVVLDASVWLSVGADELGVSLGVAELVAGAEEGLVGWELDADGEDTSACGVDVAEESTDELLAAELDGA